MRITLNPKMILRFRVVQLIALSGVIALAACQDVTGPETVAEAPNTLRLTQSSSADELASLGASFDDMSGSALATFQDISQRANIVEVLSSLKAHLNSGNVSLIQQDVTQVRGIIGSLTLGEQVQLGSVTVALNLVERKAGGGR